MWGRQEEASWQVEVKRSQQQVREVSGDCGDQEAESRRKSKKGRALSPEGPRRWGK